MRPLFLSAIAPLVFRLIYYQLLLHIFRIAYRAENTLPHRASRERLRCSFIVYFMTDESRFCTLLKERRRFRCFMLDRPHSFHLPYRMPFPLRLSRQVKVSLRRRHTLIAYERRNVTDPMAQHDDAITLPYNRGDIIICFHYSLAVFFLCQRQGHRPHTLEFSLNISAPDARCRMLIMPTRHCATRDIDEMMASDIRKQSAILLLRCAILTPTLLHHYLPRPSGDYTL